MNKIRLEYMEDSVISALYFAETKPEYEEENGRLEECLRELKETFDVKEQRVILLRVMDEANLIRAYEARDSYAMGFRRGIQLMTECLYLEA